MAYLKLYAVLLLAVIIGVVTAKPGYLGGYGYGGYGYGYPYGGYGYRHPFYGYGGYGGYGYPFGYGHGFGHFGYI